jgi:peptidoglycan/xylan/chitin deacetylase (PgdA/CDA1 family)
MRAKMITVIVLMILLMGCGRYSEDIKTLAGIGHNAKPLAVSPASMPEDATSALAQPTATMPIAPSVLTSTQVLPTAAIPATSIPTASAPTAAIPATSISTASVPTAAMPVTADQPAVSADPTVMTTLPAATVPAKTVEPLADQTAMVKYNIKEHVIYSGARHKEKKAALTFDDGPDSKYTDQILDILKKQNVNATFFVVGDHASAHKEVMKRIINNGHELGNHTSNHKDLTQLDEAQLAAEITATDEIITSFSGQPSILLRPPYGAISKPVIDYSEQSHKIICWSVDTRDWEGISAEQILDNVKRELRPGAIILQHSAGGHKGNLSNTVQALPQIIAYLKENGYKLVTVSDLIQ